MENLNDHSSRAHALLSASSAHRWMNCPASAKLAAKYPAQDTPFTREGTLAHEVAEAFARGNQILAKVADKKVSDDGIELSLERIDPEMIRHAEAYRDYIDGLKTPGCTVLLEQRVDFSQWVVDGFGTADCLMFHSNGIMDVVDYKYGQGVEVSAENNPQMMLYALGAMSDFEVVYDFERIRMHIFQPRKDNISVFELTKDELLEFAYKVTNAALATMEAVPRMEAGSWCKFCPHAGKCPGLALYCIASCFRSSLDCFHSSLDELCPNPQEIGPEAISYILGVESMITAWLKKVKEQAQTALLNGEDIPGYKVVEGKLGNRAWSDELKVAEALEAAGLAREDYTTVQLLSPAAMDKAIGKKRAAELLSDLIVRSPGAPTVVPASDKRPKLDRLAQARDDFKE